MDKKPTVLELFNDVLFIELQKQLRNEGNMPLLNKKKIFDVRLMDFDNPKRNTPELELALLALCHEIVSAKAKKPELKLKGTSPK